MTLTVHQFPCLQDNYGFIVRDDATGLVACVDTPDPTVILEELARLGWTLAYIVNTHWHADHAGGNARLKSVTGADIIGPAEIARTSSIDRIVDDGDVVMLGQTRFDVIGAPGHTLGHVVYHDAGDGLVFVGDTLFPMGCGRLFEGTAQQMWSTLRRLADLPSETCVFAAHEYAVANARFAVSIDDDRVVRARADALFAARERGEPTIPTTMGVELATNPFLRADVLAMGLGVSPGLSVAAFAAVRAAKDSFKG